MSAFYLPTILLLLVAFGCATHPISSDGMRRAGQPEDAMNKVYVRYIVEDVDAAIKFYTQSLDFELLMHPAPGFAALQSGSLQLLLNAPGAGGAGQVMSDGSSPTPGGWNRIQLRVDDLGAMIERLRQGDVHFRNDMVTGNGGKQILLQDPSGNLIELFEPFAR